MKVIKYEQGEYETPTSKWLLDRKGKITGSKLKDIIVKRGTGEKIGFYEIIAERVALPADDENPMMRGIRIEEEAVLKFQEKTGKEVDTSLVIWESDENQDIAISPDGFIGETEAVEVKCLSSAKHIQSIMENKIPDDYEYQVVQYFVVNQNLNRLHFVMYDPRMPEKWQLNVIEITRDDVMGEVEEYGIDYQKSKLAKIEKAVLLFTF